MTRFWRFDGGLSPCTADSTMTIMLTFGSAAYIKHDNLRMGVTAGVAATGVFW